MLVGPRRLVLLVDDLPEREPDEWVKGPPEQLREKAAEGFAKKQGVGVDDLEVRDGFLGVLVPGRPLLDALPERLNEIVRGLAFSKSMRWDDSGLRFARPVRWLCAKLDDRTVEGFGGSSYGHRFTHGEVADPERAASTSRRCVPQTSSRTRTAAGSIDRATASRSWDSPSRTRRCWRRSSTWPSGRPSSRAASTSASSRFRAAWSRRRWSRTSATSRSRATASRSWPTAATRRPSSPETRASSRDASKMPPSRSSAMSPRASSGSAEESTRITFVAGAGTYGDKAARLQVLVEALGGGDASREAARLAKADQAAELVREFPDLEGHIGAEYARLAGFPEAVCAAIDEQYLPDSAGGPLPETETGRVLAAADKVDSLTVAFALGQRPTGSRDPYGLRRAAIGLCRLALEGNLELDVAALSVARAPAARRPGGRAERRRERRRRVRRGAAGGDARRPRRVRTRRAGERRHGARCNRPPRRGSCSCRRHRGVRAGLRRLRPREPAGGEVRRGSRRARSQAGHRRRRARAHRCSRGSLAEDRRCSRGA